MTNKLPGRIGDTPTLGAGFWAEEWQETHNMNIPTEMQAQGTPASLAAPVSAFIPGLASYMAPPPSNGHDKRTTKVKETHAVALSGTGNGDSVLRLNAVRTAAAIARFSTPYSSDLQPGHTSLQNAISKVAGPNGMLQQSAEDRWQKTGEGEGGMIGIECADGKGQVVFDFNCGGMFRAWIDQDGRERFRVFRDEV